MDSHQKHLWFSFVEIIITISIIVLIAVVSANFYSWTKEKSLNSQNKIHIDALTNSILTYTLQNKTRNLLLPSWNRKFYTENSTFTDNWENSETFWVSGFITNETYPNKDIWDVPVDTKTQQNFWYGIVKNTPEFELAWIIWENGNPLSYVNGNYTAEDAVENLIKEYAGPNFVTSYSSEFFPYNPDEKKLIAKIKDFSWNIEIYRNNAKIYFWNSGELLNFVFIEWDSIIVPQWDYAQIYFSDGSESYLGSNNQKSELTLSKLSYKEKESLITHIQLALKIGTIWTKAPKLEENSEFQIFSQDTTASVRWTVFGVSTENNNTEVIVKRWIVEVKKNINTENFDKLLTDLSTGNTIEQEKIESPFVNDNSEIVVIWEEEWKGISINESKIEQTELKNESIPETVQSYISHNASPLSNNIVPKVLEYKLSDNQVHIELELHESFKYDADIIKIDEEIYLTNNWKDSETLILNENTYFKKIDSDERIKFIDYILTKNSNELEINFWKNTQNWVKNQSKSLILILEKIEYSWTEMVEIETIEDYVTVEENTEITPVAKGDITDESTDTEVKDDTIINNTNWTIYARGDYNQKKYFSIVNADGDKRLREAQRSIITNCALLKILFISGSQCNKKARDFWAQDYDSNYSFVSYDKNIKGVYVDNSKNEDILQYKYDSVLKNSQNMKVSISVRWSDLNRRTWQYTLYSNKYEYIQLDNGNLTYNSKIPWKSSEKLIWTLKVSNMKLKNSDFYSVVLEKEWKNTTLKVEADNLHLLWGNGYQISGNIEHSKVANYFYVWWISEYNFFHNRKKQWNWVIDSIHFYIKD